MIERYGGRLCVLLATALFVVVCAVVATGCGGAGDQTIGESSHGVITTPFSSPQFHFSLRYPTGYTPVVLRESQLPRGAVFQALFTNERGAVADGTALDVFSVTVYRLSSRATTADLRTHKADFSKMIAQLVGRPRRLTVLEQPALSKLGGDAALVTQYTQVVAGQKVVTKGYLVPKGRRAYWICAQTSSATMANSTMGVALGSIRFD